MSRFSKIFTSIMKEKLESPESIARNAPPMRPLVIEEDVENPTTQANDYIPFRWSVDYQKAMELLCDNIWKKDDSLFPRSPDHPGTIQNVTFCGDGTNIGKGINVNIGCINIGPNVVAMKKKKKFQLLKKNMHRSIRRKGVEQTEEEFVEKWSNDMS
jgi:hypothetical protein